MVNCWFGLVVWDSRDTPQVTIPFIFGDPMNPLADLSRGKKRSNQIGTSASSACRTLWHKHPKTVATKRVDRTGNIGCIPSGYKSDTVPPKMYQSLNFVRESGIIIHHPHQDSHQQAFKWGKLWAWGWGKGWLQTWTSHANKVFPCNDSLLQLAYGLSVADTWTYSPIRWTNLSCLSWNPPI